MKKLVIIFLILCLLGGVVFFFGWVNIFVPANAYAVMVSKSSGVDETLVGPESGLVWRWQHLIPTNLALHVFTLEEFTAPASGKGSFPSSDVYAQAVPFSPDFSYEVNFTVAFRVRPQSLIRLVKNEGLTPQTLNAFYDKRKEAIVRGLLEDLFDLAEKGEAALLKNPFALEKALLARAADRSGDVEVTRLTPQGTLKLPDPAIYFKARQNYQALLDEQRRIAIEKMRRAQALYERDDITFDRSVAQLERYGELFNKYPVLLKYLFIRGNPSGAQKAVPEIIDLFETKGTATP